MLDNFCILLFPNSYSLAELLVFFIMCPRTYNNFCMSMENIYHAQRFLVLDEVCQCSKSNVNKIGRKK